MTAAESLTGFRWVEFPEGTEALSPDRLAEGFIAAGAAVGIKDDGAPDLALLASSGAPTSSAIVLTTNAVAAAPVRLCREGLDSGRIGAVVVTSGNANCATGERGMEVATEVRDSVAAALGLDPTEVAIAQTGVIGVQLDPGPVVAAVPGLVERLGPDGGGEFAEAILTTDAGTKSLTVKAGGVTVSAQAKGAGMIEPGLATMLCFVQTDAVVEEPRSVLGEAVGRSFNRISVDGQMSTNDTVLLQASGASGLPLPVGMLDAVLLELALAIVADGEGATRIARVSVEGANDRDEADRVARAIGNSPLVKTALFGRDPNWGRILQAAGAALKGEDLTGLDEQAVRADELGGPDDQVEIGIDLGRGDGSGHQYFSDLTHRYIEINAEYTT
ncbi:MAG: bifunctional glutamate N-acetyltransferase/amino-acid acetyltransferase ArgJ [Solirubrobacterales bacterium]